MIRVSPKLKTALVNNSVAMALLTCRGTKQKL
jgi:hypothetical protein